MGLCKQNGFKLKPGTIPTVISLEEADGITTSIPLKDGNNVDVTPESAGIKQKENTFAANKSSAKIGEKKIKCLETEVNQIPSYNPHFIKYIEAAKSGPNANVVQKGYDKDSSSNQQNLSTHNLKESTLEVVKPEPVDEMEVFIEDLNFHGHNTRKCGEIVFDADDETFTLNCFSCTAICLDLLTFSEHVKKQHAALLKQNVENPLDIEINYVNKSDTNLKLKSVANEETNETCLSNVKSETSNFELNNNEVQSPSSITFNKDKESNNVKEANNFEIKIDHYTVISQFICLLKQKPVIWNKSIQTLSCYQSSRSAITSIIDSLKISFPDLTFTFKNVTNLLYTLHVGYHNELKQIKNAEKRNMKYIPRLWCFNKLTFLEDNLLDREDVGSLKRIASQFPLDIYKVKTPDNEMITLDIIHHYEKQPQLWNINHPEYSGKLNNEESFQFFYDLISKKYSHKVNITKKDFKMAIDRMHQWYIAEKSIQRYMKKQYQPFNSYYPHIYKALSFLQCNLLPYRCSTCNKLFKIDDNYVQHKKNCEAVVHECEYCQKRFPAFKYLKNHLHKHSNERPAICAICGKAYKNTAYLSAHVRSHKDKLFKCSECNRSYQTLTTFNTHQKSHLGIRDKVCDICGKAFTATKYLYNHRITHFEENKRVCNNCGRTLAAASMSSHKKNCAARLLRQSTKRSRRKKTSHAANESILNVLTNQSQVKTIVKTERIDKTNSTIVQFSIEPYYSAIGNNCSFDKDLI